MYKFNKKSIGKTSRKTLFIPILDKFHLILDKYICGKLKNLIRIPR